MTNWKTVKLKEIADITRGGSPRPIEQYITKEEGYNWLRIGDVPKDGKYISKVSARIKPEGLSKTTLVHKGDFILSNSMSYGRPYITMVDTCIHDGWLALRNLNTQLIDRNYLYYLLLHPLTQYKFSAMSAGSGVQNLKKETVNEIEVKIPSVGEQKRIVSLVESWDVYLEKLDKKIELKKNIKKGLMQQLLISNESWKKSTVSEVFSFIPTGSHSKEAMTYSDTGNKPLNIHYGDIHTKYQDYIDFDSHQGIPHLTSDGVNQRMLLQDGDLVVADASEDYDGVGACVELKNLGDRKCIAGLHTFALRPKGGLIAPGFAKLVFKESKTANWLKRVSTYSKVYGLSKFNFSKTEVYLPSYEEQQKIVYILDTIALEINLLEKKRIYLGEQKKYLANNLISGKIRTPENLTMPAKEVQYA